jgi:circadian clock protein KaiC
MHLAIMHKMVEDFDPSVVIVDPISNFVNAASNSETNAMLVRLVDFLKSRGTTAFFTALTGGGEAWEQTDVGMSSIVDTWLLLRDIELGGERNRGMYILKSRGMAHSNQIREFLLTDNGIDLLDVYVGPEGVLTGSMRVAQEAREKAHAQSLNEDVARKRRVAQRRRKAVEAQIAALQAELAADELELDLAESEDQQRLDQFVSDRASMSKSRKADLSQE